MNDDDPGAELADIEERIEHLRDTIESCRKAMLLSRGAIIAGSVLFVANLIGVIAPSLLLGLLSFTAIVAGIVWLGANKSSREEALAALKLAQSHWRTATDQIEMSTIGE
ncbi:MAG: hypothetical protein JOZ16_02035 [Methylobacteriaceae bacterium]|nr:hypothetical protein [Methylobacteriaceae bacterium]